MQKGFDNAKYISLQAERIKERVSQSGGKLYLEFGGKLFDDFHASRVLPGFEPDTKIRMLQSMAGDVEIIIAINANHIEKSKVRGDLGITYDEDVLRLMDVFEGLGFYVGSVCITQYANQPAADVFCKRLEDMGVAYYKHFPIAGYPHDVEHIVSDEGYGLNEYIQTTRPLVVVTAPGPCSGKMATCLSQLYHEHKNGVRAGYSKYETFPIWNLPLDHPVNIAYEAATADLDDANIIDPWHLEAYGETTVNYNRDVEVFPVLKAMLDTILGESPYKSPTDMGVNCAGFGIFDDAVCRKAGNAEIVRRYFTCAVKNKRTGMFDEELSRMELIMKRAGLSKDYLPARAHALAKAQESGAPAGAIVLDAGAVITGKTSDLLGAASSLLLNAAKHLAGIPRNEFIISDEALAPICKLKTEHLGSRNPRLHPNEMLIALSTSSSQSAQAKAAIDALEQLRGCDMFFSAIISESDEQLLKKLGINVCCEPVYEREQRFHG